MTVRGTLCVSVCVCGRRRSPVSGADGRAVIAGSVKGGGEDTVDTVGREGDEDEDDFMMMEAGGAGCDGER